MLSLHSHLRIYIALEPCDMRKGFDGLWALAETVLGEDPRQGALFVFTNRHRTRIKLLHFDGSGSWVHAKRLELGTFQWPRPSEGGSRSIKLAPEALQLLLDGVDLREGCRRAWYEQQ